jgi:hypothetical protein
VMCVRVAVYGSCVLCVVQGRHRERHVFGGLLFESPIRYIRLYNKRFTSPSAPPQLSWLLAAFHSWKGRIL